jgi:hypothetical protein
MSTFLLESALVAVVALQSQQIQVPCPKKDVPLGRVDVRIGHWQFVGPVGVVVCDHDATSLSASLRRTLKNSYEAVIHDLTLFSLNLCEKKKPSPEWSDQKWFNFRHESIVRLNSALPVPYVQDVTCDLLFVEYEPVLPKEPSG